ncbi:MAG: NUDIX hydrolase [Myxococcota bacterium]|nr:NUDIX hydrolase [Myxococcota bacterium]
MDALYRTAYRLAWWLGQRIFRFYHPHVDGVAVLVWHDERLLLVRNSYRETWGPPGGLRRRRADARSEALRELREEVGFEPVADSLRDAGMLEVEHSYVCDHVRFFELRVEEEPELVIDNREVVEARFCDEATLGRLPLWKPLRVYLDRDEALASTRSAGA